MMFMPAPRYEADLYPGKFVLPCRAGFSEFLPVLCNGRQSRRVRRGIRGKKCARTLSLRLPVPSAKRRKLDRTVAMTSPLRQRGHHGDVLILRINCWPETPVCLHQTGSDLATLRTREQVLTSGSDLRAVF